MAPTNKVTKPRAPPKRSTSRTQATLTGQSKDVTKSNQNLLFLWACFQSTGASADFKKVAPAFGLKVDTARVRLVRLKAHIEQLQKAGQSGPKPEGHAQQEDQEDQEEEHEGQKIKIEGEDFVSV